MGVSNVCNIEKPIIIKSFIECIYNIDDNNNEIQIINYRGEKFVNEEIESKVKILYNNRKEKIKYKKKFEKKGINSIHFIIEGEINDLSYIFNKCSSLIEINFINF